MKHAVLDDLTEQLENAFTDGRMAIEDWTLEAGVYMHVSSH